MSSTESNPHKLTSTRSNLSSPPRSQCAQAPVQDEKKRRRRKKKAEKAAPPDPSKVDTDDENVATAEEALNIAMPVQEGLTNKSESDAMADVMQPLKQSNGMTAFKEEELAGIQSMNNGFCNDNVCRDDNDQLSQVLLDLTSQNAYLKAQFDGLKGQLHASMETFKQGREVPNENVDSQQVKQLQEDLKKLNKEIQEQKETQKAAEDALEHLRIALSEADSRAEDLSVKLAEAQNKREEEIKERDDKYVELDSKFGRLHKRAKQRIQELQKEKDDLEIRVRDVNDIAEKASSQQSSMQQELERTRQQASEALRSMDTERQQLRTANIKFRDNIDELHRSLEAKENVLEGLRQSLFEKEQALAETQRMLQASEEKKQMSLTEVSSKHQKAVESLEAQIAEALHERSKLAETISSLQALVLEKDSKIAELDAASTGEAVRLGAAVEAAKAEIASLRDEHEKEKEKWDSACQTLRAKLEASENTCLRSEIEAAKLRSQLELELSLQNQLLSTKDSELLAAKQEVVRLESDFSSYKVRAHALLQKKEADLQAATESDAIKAQEEAIREAEREVLQALTERDKALQDLQNVLANHDKEIASRDAALVDAEKRAGSLSIKLGHVNGQYLSDKEAWQKSLADLEESWRLKYDMLEAQKNVESGNDLERRLEDLQMQHEKLKEEHETFRDIADRMLEEKEKEISKLLDENKSLHQSLEAQPPVNYNDNLNSAFVKQDAQSSSVAAAEQQILLLARQQAQREEELAQSQRHILALQDEIEELERENRLRSQQEAMLKEELRNMERNQKREGVDMTYLKNVVLKLLETGEVEALLPVVGMLLQFSPEEIRKCQQTYRPTSNIPLSPVAFPPDAASSTPRSLFSRFPFT